LNDKIIEVFKQKVNGSCIQCKLIHQRYVVRNKVMQGKYKEDFLSEFSEGFNSKGNSVKEDI